MTEAVTRLAEWAAAALELEAVLLTRVSSGNSRQSWLVAAADVPDDARWILRVDPGMDPAAFYSLAREGKIYRALNQVRAPVSRLIAEGMGGSALLFERAPGEADIQLVPPPARRIIVIDFLRNLADIHRRSLDDLALTELNDGGGVSGCVLAEIDRWEQSIRTSPSPPDPLLEYGSKWLRAHLPQNDDQPVLVHGDAGPGNFLYQDGRTTSIIDWEFGHAGEPMEDLAWVSLRAAFDSVPDLGDVLLDHCREHGIAPDDARLRFYQVLVLWRVLIIRHLAIGDTSRNLGRNVFYRLMHRRMFIDVLGRGAGLREPDLAGVERRSTERSWLYDACIAQIKATALPALDGNAQTTIGGLIRVLRYLSIWEGSAETIQEQAQLASVSSADTSSSHTGVPLASPEGELAVAIRDNQVSESDALRAITALVITEHELCRDLLGGLADLKLVGFATGAQSEVDEVART